MNEAVVRYWIDHYSPKGLCGNSGKIDTTGTRTAAGVHVGRINFCICPNGQSLRAHGAIIGVAMEIER